MGNGKDNEETLCRVCGDDITLLKQNKFEDSKYCSSCYTDLIVNSNIVEDEEYIDEIEQSATKKNNGGKKNIQTKKHNEPKSYSNIYKFNETNDYNQTSGFGISPVGVTIKTIGIITIIIGVVGGFYFGDTMGGYDFNFLLFSAFAIPCFLSGIMFWGFAEIINLLFSINKKMD